MTDTDAAPPLPRFPRGWTRSAKDAVTAILLERPDLAGADFAAAEQIGHLITTADRYDAIAKKEPMTTGSTGQIVVNPAASLAVSARHEAALIMAKLSTSAPKSRQKPHLQRPRDERRRPR